MTTWYPLGYNIRPRRLQSIAREAVTRFDGRLPDDEATLRSFKGIGAYTAGAVMSFAFGKRAAILDTNVARVLFRVFVGDGRPEFACDGAAACGTSRAPCCLTSTSSTSIRRSWTSAPWRARRATLAVWCVPSRGDARGGGSGLPASRSVARLAVAHRQRASQSARHRPPGNSRRRAPCRVTQRMS